MTATCAEAPTNAESRTNPATRSPTPAREQEERMGMAKVAPMATLARLEQMTGIKPDQVKLRARLEAAEAAVEVAPVQTLGAEAPSEGAGRVVNLRREPFEVYIGRPSEWGNPFILGKDGTREEVLAKYRTYLNDHPELVARARVELKGKVLGCFCAPLPCHGDVLLRAANASPATTRDERAYYLVSVAGGSVSYTHRDALKELHLRWDPTAREWSGIVLGSDIGTFEALGLAVEVRRSQQPREPTVPGRKRDHAKASVEAYAGRAEGRASMHLSLLEVTSGLPDDSREDDERVRTQAERERQGRVAAALAALEAHPAARAQVFHNQTRCAMFCARYGVTPADICPYVEDLSARVVAPGTPRDGMCTWCHTWHGWARPVDVADVAEVLATPADWLSEVRAREVAVLPGSDCDDG